MEIVNNIKKLRQEKNITQFELAEALEVTRTLIVMYEQNRRFPHLEMAFKIARFFNKRIEEVFMLEEDIINDYEKMIEKIKKQFGRNTIIIKNNLVFRISTRVLEIGPKELLSFNLPNYGKMKKLVIFNDKIYLLSQTRDYISRTDMVSHKIIGDPLEIDFSLISFNENKAWNYKK